MPTTSQLKAQIKANNTALEALRKQGETIHIEVEAKNKDLQERFNKYFIAVCSVPDEISKREFTTFISDEMMRFKWQEFKRPQYTSELTIRYRKPGSYENPNKEDNNHAWEISLSSSYIYVDTTEKGHASRNHESFYINSFALNLRRFLIDYAVPVVKFHEEYYQLKVASWDIHEAIDKIERDTRDAESKIERNTIIEMFKPHGETSTHIRMNVDIPTFLHVEHNMTDTYRYGKARHKYYSYNALNITKQTNKSLIVDFIRTDEWKDENGKEQMRRWVEGTKRLEFNDLVSMMLSSKHQSERETKRKIENAEREAKRQAELNKQTENA